MATKYFSLLLALTLMTGTALGGSLECRGGPQGNKIFLKGSAPGILLTEASGSLMLNQIEVAKFEASDMKWDMIDKSFRFRNSRGDEIVGSFDNYMAGLATLNILRIPGKIDLTNVKVKCKTL